MKKILFIEGPEVIRTDEGDIKRGEAFEASDGLAERLLAHEHYEFVLMVISDQPAVLSKTKKKKEEVRNEEEK